MTSKVIGSPCAIYGPYTFYKAFKYSKNGKTNILSLSEFFFVKLWSDSDLVSIGELILLWEDRNNEQTLACLRLYILPENTPDGRNDALHGEDEVLAITEKVVLRLEDLLTWLTEDADWNWGLGAMWQPGTEYRKTCTTPCLNSSTNIDFSDVDKEKETLSEEHWETNKSVVVLSFTRYCRYRGLLRRFEGVHNKWLRNPDIVALGGFRVPYKNTKVLFCKDSFDYPDLEGHELLCNHLAPKYKGRNSKKKKKLLITNIDSDSGSESSSTVSSTNKSPNKTGLTVRLNPSRKSPRISDSKDERDFLNKLYQFMKTRKTPIGRLPSVGFKELDLYKLFAKVKHLGGYDEVTSGRLWKYVFAEIGGEHGTTSAGTLSRKHYERLLLPYEKHLARQSEVSNGKKTSNKGKVNGNVTVNSSQNSSKKEKDHPSKEKESPIVTLEDSSNSSSNSNSNSNQTFGTSSTDKPNNFSMVKRKIVMEGNSSSLRNARLKLEKPPNGDVSESKVITIDASPTPTPISTPEIKQSEINPNSFELNKSCSNGQVSPPRDKENIPLQNKPGEKRLAPEIIDITDDSGPQTINAYKKQKLDILKYQGLEVTPVSSEDVKPPIAHPPPNIPPLPIATPQTDFRNKISITVTPDVSLLLKPNTSSGTPPLPSTSSTNKGFSNPPLSSNLFSPFQHGTKIVYGNPKDALSSSNSPKDALNSNSKDLFISSSKDLFSSSSKDIPNSSSKDLFKSSQKDIFNSTPPGLGLLNSLDPSHNTKDILNNPKDLFNYKDIFSNRSVLGNMKNPYTPPKDLFQNTSAVHNMFANANLKDFLTNPSFKDVLTNTNFKDILTNPAFKDILFNNVSKDLFNKDFRSPPKPNYHTSPKASSPSNFQPTSRLSNSHLKSGTHMSSPTSSSSFEGVLDLKVKPHPTVPATLSASGQSLKRSSSQSTCFQQDEVLDLTVKSGKKDDPFNTSNYKLSPSSNLEITLIPSSHRPYDSKRPLPVPLPRQQQSSRLSASPKIDVGLANNHKMNSSPSLHHSYHGRADLKLNHNLSQSSFKKNNNLLVIPPSNQSQSHNSHRSKRKSSSSIPIPPVSRSSQLFPSHSKNSVSSSSSGNSSIAAQNIKNTPYMPMMDPVYFAALYSGLFPSNFMNPATAALFTPPAAQAQTNATEDAALNIYKEFLKAQNSPLLPNLFPDGTTSISLVGNNKPANK